MRIGFTGTRNGMTKAQAERFGELIVSLNGPEFCRDAEFHHGDCVGADDEAATMAHESGLFEVVCHPPADEKLRAFNPYSSSTLPAKTHFERNRAIVDASDWMIVCPYQMERLAHGGTWYTHWYAEKKGKPITIIWPDGTTEQTPARPAVQN